jgi:hypothetical protein
VAVSFTGARELKHHHHFLIPTPPTVLQTEAPPSKPSSRPKRSAVERPLYSSLPLLLLLPFCLSF